MEKKTRTPLLLSLAVVIAAACLLGSCSGKTKAPASAQEEADADTIPVDADQFVCIETSEGNIVVHLFRDTPRHRHNFIKLVRKGYYDNQLFYRIVNNSLIQAGDPNSKGATKETTLGTGDVDYTLEPELLPERHINTRGAVGMASYKPLYESSGGQFYIVTGLKQSDVRLNNAETHLNKKRREMVFDSITKQPSYQTQLREMNKKGDKRGMFRVKEEIKEQTDEIMKQRQPFAYSKEQRKAYQTIGGEATLDGLYTVFGEVIEGDSVLTKIEKRAVNADRRPYDDVVIRRITEIPAPKQ
ncbi:MAG: peptidylprolyl isomerase [Bacteroidaceae bacterium]|nr:peptidylprolyl isomerase [Bacteroidaceae bacterium]